MNYPSLPAAVLRSRVAAAPNRNERKLLAKPPGRVTDHLEAIARLAPLIAEHRAAFDSARKNTPRLPQALSD